MGLISRVFQPIARAASSLFPTEGAYRPGPYFLNNGFLPADVGQSWNWWQTGYTLAPYGETSAMVEACVGAYSQTVAMCPGAHWLKLDNGGREQITNSDLSRILKQPNDYQSMSDFLLNMTRSLYLYGEAFAVVLRNNRSEVSEIHQMRLGMAIVAGDGSVFYSLTGNEIVQMRYDLSSPIPARDVMHIRLHTPTHVLKGVSPLLANKLPLLMTQAVINQQIAFYLNQAKPSFLLETDNELNETQRDELRASWNKQTQGAAAGGTPILSWGLKAKPVTVTAQDGQVADLLKVNDQGVALAFRIPLQILGIGGTPFASTEALMQSWISSGLGFAINHIETAFDRVFNLDGIPDEYTEFDTQALLRSAFKERMDGLVAGVMGGVMSSDEARAQLELPVTPGGYGAMPRVQQQVVPLSYGAQMVPPNPNAKPSSSGSSPKDDPNESSENEPASSDSAKEDAAEASSKVIQLFRTSQHAEQQRIAVPD
jgi:HK97 family phage portal protein